MKIAILEDWILANEEVERLRQLAPVTVYESTSSEDEAIGRLEGFDIGVVNGLDWPITRKLLGNVCDLKLLVLPSTAYHCIDLEAASENGIRVSNVPGFSTEAVAEHAIALMFSVIRRVTVGNQKIRETPFQATGAEGEGLLAGFEIKGKTLGVLGLGAIGSRVAELGLGLGMKVIAYNRSPRQQQGVEMVQFDDLLRESDVVSVNLALAPETEKVIGERELRLMKSSAVLVNTAMGDHVSTDALYNALADRRIFGAGLDLLAEWDEENPLLQLENVVLTPHTAWLTGEANRNFADIIVENIDSFLKGWPTNLLN